MQLATGAHLLDDFYVIHQHIHQPQLVSKPDQHLHNQAAHTKQWAATMATTGIRHNVHASNSMGCCLASCKHPRSRSPLPSECGSLTHLQARWMDGNAECLLCKGLAELAGAVHIVPQAQAPVHAACGYQRLPNTHVQARDGCTAASNKPCIGSDSHAGSAAGPGVHRSLC